MTIIIVFKEQLQNWFLRVVSVLFIMRANAWIFGLDAVIDVYMFYRLLDFKDDDCVTLYQIFLKYGPPNGNMYGSVG